MTVRLVVHPLVLAGCASWVVCASVPAHAWCRTHTEDTAATQCPEPCSNLGAPLYWAQPNPTYAFNGDGFPGLTDAHLRSLFASSFQTWENARCHDGDTVGLDIRAEAEPTTLRVGPKADEPNKNVILHMTVDDWDEQDLPTKAFAITAVWYDAEERSLTVGEILGADIMFNGAMDPFGECSSDGCMASGPTTDLRNVATHEIGHFLGLSHSMIKDSTMWCDASPQEISKRSLSQDDIDGLCKIYPPGAAFLSDERSGGGGELNACSLAARPRGTLAGVAALLLSALALLWRRRGKATRVQEGASTKTHLAERQRNAGSISAPSVPRIASRSVGRVR